MSKVSIASGLNDQRTLLNSQLVIVGTKPHLKNLQLDKNLAAKLTGVDEKLFKAAIGQIEKAGSVPLYLNLAKVRSFLFSRKLLLF